MPRFARIARRRPSGERPAATARTVPIPSPTCLPPASVCARCNGGTAIPYLGCPVYDTSWGGCIWIEVIWQGYPVMDQGKAVARLSQLPSLIAYCDPVPGSRGAAGRRAPSVPVVAILRSEIWGPGDDALMTSLSDRLPAPVALLVADLPVWTG